jgi:hypothetical protein
MTIDLGRPAAVETDESRPATAAENCPGRDPRGDGGHRLDPARGPLLRRPRPGLADDRARLRPGQEVGEAAADLGQGLLLATDHPGAGGVASRGRPHRRRPGGGRRRVGAEARTGPGGGRAHAVCGTLQLLVFLAYAALAGVVFSAGYEWVSAGSGRLDPYLRSVALGAATFAGVCLPVEPPNRNPRRASRRQVRIVFDRGTITRSST